MTELALNFDSNRRGGVICPNAFVEELSPIALKLWLYGIGLSKSFDFVKSYTAGKLKLGSQRWAKAIRELKSRGLLQVKCCRRGGQFFYRYIFYKWVSNSLVPLHEAEPHQGGESVEVLEPSAAVHFSVVKEEPAPIPAAPPATAPVNSVEIKQAVTLIFDLALANLQVEEKLKIESALNPIESNSRQVLLDELNHAVGKGNVKSPIAYMHKLVRIYKEGKYTPSGAKEIEKKRIADAPRRRWHPVKSAIALKIEQMAEELKAQMRGGK